MLTALEFAGFKSFADPTRFEFSDGITTIIGPNGSGKSNIVDAVKWVMGTQSAKSLRGGEMTDVIFAGSASTGRKPAGSAEATLIFNNSQRRLQCDADTVRVTRRVYRSGETEYLLNDQRCRLKDIRDLFRGTGIGVDAYSLIEQGRVDRMLNASPKDRRAILEEAAGISKFKAKKIEAERRLARINQNLLRLSDIVEEVRTRLNTLKTQASKASLYRDYSDRLERLRRVVGFAEAAALKATSLELDRQQTELTQQLQAAATTLERLTSEVATRQNVFDDCQRRIEQLTEQRYSQQSERTAATTAVSHLSQRLTELDRETELLRSQSEQLVVRLESTGSQIDDRQQSVATLRDEADRLETQLLASQSQRRQIVDEIATSQAAADSSTGEAEQLRQQLAEAQWKLRTDRQTSQQLSDRQSSLQQQIAAKTDDVARKENDRRGFQQQCDDTQRQLREATANLHAVTEAAERHAADLQTAREALVRHTSSVHALGEQHALLKQLGHDRELIGSGTEQILQMAAHGRSPWDSVCGMVADLVQIDVHLAPLIDVALGHLSEAIVLSDGRLVDLLRSEQLQIEGRATLIRLDRLPARRGGEKIQLDGLRGVLGRADRLIGCDGRYEPLMNFLLGTTWLVDSLQTALDLCHYRGSGLRFVTSACERIDADGTISIASLQRLGGVMTRRGELLAIEAEIERVAAAVLSDEATIATLQETGLKHAAARTEAAEAVRLAQRQLDQATFELQQFDQRIARQSEELQQLESEAADVRTQDAATRQVIAETEARIEQLTIAQKDSTAAIGKAAEELAQTRERLRALDEQINSQQLELTTVRSRLESERVLINSLHADRDDRQVLASEIADKLAAAAARREQLVAQESEARQKIIQLDSQLQQLAESAAQAQSELAAAGETLKAANSSVSTANNQCNGLRAAREENARQQTIAAESFEQLLVTYRDEHGIDLADVSQIDDELAEQIESLDRAAAGRELHKLRAGINDCGAVNMEALAELDEQQSRLDTMDAHYRDLVSARDDLCKIIERIDAKSTQMFIDTLSAVRANFQTIFRRSFGGGTADIVLEDENDVLGCGVEVVATPPGKVELNNSLRSGGEKAMTAVALIMAIFQFRPSPFCILDEVDAALDQANIGRFLSVIKEFLDTTKFIIISHNAKTLTAADLVYGVTMEEGGVSRRVSVRFEDVGEDGQIRKEAA